MTWEFKLADKNHGWFTEGPAWDGAALLFTHIPTSRILRYDPETDSTSVYRTDTNNANGLMFDPQGRLYACEGGARRVVRYEGDGGVTVIADSFEGNRLNIPNDLAIDLNGSVWFTDPYYGAAVKWQANEENKDLDHSSVYRADPRPDGSWRLTRVTFDTTAPNGILFSLDHKTLFVAQSSDVPEGDRQLRAYPVNEDGSLGSGRVLYDFGADRSIDGMCLDTEGNVLATAGSDEGGPGASIWVFSNEGEVVDRHPVPESPTNCTFGDADLRTLYVTTGTGDVFMARTERQGRLLYPPVDRT